MNNHFKLGKPLNVIWHFKRPDGENYSLAGLQHELVCYNSRGRFKIKDSVINVEDTGVLSFTLKEEMQTVEGAYSFHLSLLRHGKTVNTVVKNDAVILSKHIIDTNSIQEDEPTTIEIFSVGEFELFRPTAPVAGSDGWWYFDGQPILDDEGNKVPINVTIDIDDDPESETFGIITLDKGRDGGRETVITGMRNTFLKVREQGNKTEAQGIEAERQGNTAEAQGNVAEEQGDVAEAQGLTAKAQGEKTEQQGNIAEQKGSYAAHLGNIAEEQGNTAKQRGEKAEQQGNTAEAQGNVAEQQGLTAKAQGDKAEAQGNTTEAQGNQAVQIATDKGNEAIQIATDKGDEAISIAQTAANTANTAANNANTAAQEARDGIAEMVTAVENAKDDIVAEVNDTTGVAKFPPFDATSAYSIGEIVNYQGKLYKFTADHAIGDWIGTDATPYSLKEYNDNKLTELESKEIVIYPLEWIGKSGAGHISAVGQYYYNTSEQKIKLVTEFINSNYFITKDIDPIDKGLYTYNGKVYIYTQGIGMSEYHSYSMDSRPNPITSEHIPESSGTYVLITEHGASRIDAAYTLRKVTIGETADQPIDDLEGTRIRVIFKITKPMRAEFTTSYRGIVNVYDNLYNAIYARTSSILDTITGDIYSTGASGDTTNEGWLCFSIRKTDNSVITDAEKIAILSDLQIKLYAKGSFAELLNNTTQQNKKDIENLFQSDGNLNTISLNGIIITLPAKVTARIKSSSLSAGVKIIGRNLLDASSFQAKQIINDSGEVISDNTSSYYSYLIPCYGKKLISSFIMQRVYMYAADGTFIGRTTIINRSEYTPSTNVYFARIQVASTQAISNGVVVYENEELSYEDFFIQNVISQGKMNRIYMEDGTEANIEISLYCKAVIPAVKEYSFWEPEDVTDDYKCTFLGQYIQSIPTLNALGYNGFLSTYLDTFIGKHSDGYEVKKIELGMDSGAIIEHSACPLFSYEFIPKYYNKTVLISAGMNPCEASTYFGIAYFIQALMTQIEEGMAALYNSTRFIVLPVICPTGILHNPLLYRNANDVRVNKNFSFLNSWQYNYDRGGQYPGEYPDSEVETKILKEWMNKYNGATFYIDCHSDTGGAEGQELALSQCFCSDAETKNKVETRKYEIEAFYRNKGYITEDEVPTFIYSVENGNTYPKTKYSKDVCGTPAIMHEQYIKSTAYGSDGHTNNDSYGIKNYVALLRWYCLIMCKSDAEIIF